MDDIFDILSKKIDETAEQSSKSKFLCIEIGDMEYVSKSFFLNRVDGYSFVYSITSPSGKIYVGRSCNLRVRMMQHIAGYVKSSLVSAAIKKYGPENMIVCIIDFVKKEDMCDSEAYWVVELRSRTPNGYNLTDGGEGCIHVSDATRNKISSANLGKKKPLSYSEKLSKRQIGVPKKKELKDKIRATYHAKIKSRIESYPQCLISDILNMRSSFVPIRVISSIYRIPWRDVRRIEAMFE